MKVTQFRYTVARSMYAISTTGTRAEIVKTHGFEDDYNKSWGKDQYEAMKSELSEFKKCQKFLKTANVVSVSVNHYTTQHHNNGRGDTVTELVTVITQD